MNEELRAADGRDLGDGVHLGADQEARDDLELRGDAIYVDNDSDRIDPTIEVDELGHEETAFGIGILYRF